MSHLQKGRSDQLQRALSQIRPLQLEEGHRGRLELGERTASVLLETGEWIRTRLRLSGEESQRILADPLGALDLERSLPGNVRFVLSGGVLSLQADTQADGVDHLASSFAEIRRGMLLGLGAAVTPSTGAPAAIQKEAGSSGIQNEEVSSALQGMGWPAEDVVQRDGGWELRPRLRGAGLAVRLAAEGGGLRLQRTVLKSIPEAEAGTAVALEAMRIHQRLRFARIAASEGALVVESRLHSGLIARRWIPTAARAVASAAMHSQPIFEILARESHVARCYVEMFVSQPQEEPGKGVIQVGCNNVAAHG